MGIIMVVKLYTSRVLLDVLGIDDYGVWTAVATFVIAFSFISSPLVTATQRFLNYDMGKGGLRLNKLFVTSIILFLCISLLVILALETGGVWFLNNKMNFSPDKMIYVNILFQLSIFTLIINLLRMPYESAIIAEERMSFYALLCIVETIFMLGIAFLVKFDCGYNKLIFYGILNLLITLFIAIAYKIYSNYHFKYTKIKKIRFDTKIVKEVVSFSGWNLFGACASMTATQGVSTLINIFFGVAMNATYGVAVQVQGAVRNIVQNFQKASNPQIVKSFSSNDVVRTQSLVINVCKFSYLLSLLFAIPMIFNIDFILYIWLGDNIPPMANIFSQLILILILLVSFSGPMDTAILATGKVKTFQLTYSIIIFSNIILSYIAFHLGALAYWALVIKCIVEILIIIARIVFLKRLINLSITKIIKSTFTPCILISLFTIFPLYFIMNYIMLEGWGRLLSSTALFLSLYAVLVWHIGLSQDNRNRISIYLIHKLSNNKRQ